MEAMGEDKGRRCLQAADGRGHQRRADGIACWFLDTDYDEESSSSATLTSSARTILTGRSGRAEGGDRRGRVGHPHSDRSRPFPKPASGQVAVKVINHLGDEVMKVFRVDS